MNKKIISTVLASFLMLNVNAFAGTDVEQGLYL